MPMVSDLLATELWNLEGPPTDAQGIPLPPSDGIKAYASGFVKMLKAGLVTHLPGTITGSAPPGGPLAGSKAEGGKILALLGLVMAGEASKGNPVVATQIGLEATALATYLMGAALVGLATGGITGNSTEVPPPTPAPGPLVGAAGAPVGKISGLTGAAMAQVVALVTLQTGPKIVEHYSKMAEFVMANAAVEYKVGTVVGGCTGGQLTAGAGTGGIIS